MLKNIDNIKQGTLSFAPGTTWILSWSYFLFKISKLQESLWEEWKERNREMLRVVNNSALGNAPPIWGIEREREKGWEILQLMKNAWLLVKQESLLKQEGIWHLGHNSEADPGLIHLIQDPGWGPAHAQELFEECTWWRKRVLAIQWDKKK